MLVEGNRNLKIAIVDDDHDVTNIFSKVVEKLGYPKPSVFHDGTSIVHALDKESFDVIIMDHRMPEMTGVEAAKIIHRYKTQTRIILTSSDYAVREDAQALGFPFLAKPFTMKDFAGTLESVIPVSAQET